MADHESAQELDPRTIEAASAGNLLALMDALVFCHEWRLVPPQVVFARAYRVLVALLSPGRGKSDGRHGNLMSEARDQVMHMARHDSVERILALQPRRGNVSGSAARDTEVAAILEAAFARGGLGSSQEDAFAIASALLKQSSFAASEETIGHDFREVRKSLRKGSKYYRPVHALTLALLSLTDPRNALVQAINSRCREPKARAAYEQARARPDISSFAFKPLSQNTPPTSSQSALLLRLRGVERAMAAGGVSAIVNHLYLFGIDKPVFEYGPIAPETCQCLLRATIALLRAAVLENEGRTVGKNGNRLAQDRSIWFHLMRHTNVATCLMQQWNAKELSSSVSQRQIVKGPALDAQLLADKMLGRTTKQATRRAAYIASESPWRGTPRAFETSYNLVEKAQWLYYCHSPIQPQVAQDLGIPAWFGWNPNLDPLHEAREIADRIIEREEAKLCGFEPEVDDEEHPPRADWKRLRQLSRAFGPAVARQTKLVAPKAPVRKRDVVEK